MGSEMISKIMSKIIFKIRPLVGEGELKMKDKRARESIDRLENKIYELEKKWKIYNFQGYTGTYQVSDLIAKIEGLKEGFKMMHDYLGVEVINAPPVLKLQKKKKGVKE